MNLSNKTIVLTGGSSGVGLNLLQRLASRNTVINLSRRSPDKDAPLPGNASFVHIATDLGEASSVAAAVDQIASAHPLGIDGLINCAAVQFTPRFIDPDFDPACIATEIAINLTSPIELVCGFLDQLRRRPEAFILNVNSGLGIVPKHESAVYCATKAGLDNFSRGLRAQLAGTNVRVLQAFLPVVDTPMTEGRGSSKLSPKDAADQIIVGIERSIPDNNVGKVKLLRATNRFFPALAHRIMQKGNA
jgi:uncharacterized oxidoreductase